MGKTQSTYAFIVDTHRTERERGQTLESKIVSYETSKFRLTLIDTPGHKNLFKNMIGVINQADCLVLVVSSAQGEFESSVASKGHLRD